MGVAIPFGVQFWSASYSLSPDLGNGFMTVEAMRTVLFRKEMPALFVIAAVVPFAPLLVVSYPLEDLLKRLVETFL